MSAAFVPGVSSPTVDVFHAKAADTLPPRLGRALRRRREVQICARYPRPTGLVLAWLKQEHVFIALLPRRGGSWERGYVSVVLLPQEAVGLELFIEGETAPLIAALQKSADKGGGK